MINDNIFVFFYFPNEVDLPSGPRAPLPDSPATGLAHRQRRIREDKRRKRAGLVIWSFFFASADAVIWILAVGEATRTIENHGCCARSKVGISRVERVESREQKAESRE